MTFAGRTAVELRVLVLAPVGRDAELVSEVARAAGVTCHACADVEDLCREYEAGGAGAILVTTEALGPGGLRAITGLLDSQPPWSALPLVIAVGAGSGANEVRDWAAEALGRPGAVTILERPIRLVTFQTVLRAALKSRQRQYQMRDLMEELRVSVQRLDAERVVRERFVSLLAHDLRGPLSTATMAAHLLARQPERLDQRRDLALRIERSMQRADRMIQDLLDANRLRAGHRLTLDLQTCDLTEIAQDVIADLADADRERVSLEAPNRLEGIWAPDQLRRALWNLLTNAFKYGAPGGPVTVSIRREEEGVVASVHNTGPAIPESEQRGLFEPFARAAGAEGRSRGWGLGLALVRGCADAHGGTLELSSTAEGGTTFAMRLPLDARPFQPEVRSGEAPAGG